MKDCELTSNLVNYVLHHRETIFDQPLTPTFLAKVTGGDPRRIGHVICEVIRRLQLFDLTCEYQHQPSRVFVLTKPVSEVDSLNIVGYQVHSHKQNIEYDQVE